MAKDLALRRGRGLWSIAESGAGLAERVDGLKEHAVRSVRPGEHQSHFHRTANDTSFRPMLANELGDSVCLANRERSPEWCA